MEAAAVAVQRLDQLQGGVVAQLGAAQAGVLAGALRGAGGRRRRAGVGSCEGENSTAAAGYPIGP